MNPPPRATRATGEHGNVALWLLGVCVMLLFLGGISLDLWRGYAERRGLASAADAAVVAAVQAIDPDHFRATGETRLDPALAEAYARSSLAAQPEATRLTGIAIDTEPDSVTVTLTGQIPLTLLAVLLPDHPPLPLTVRSTATPHTPDP